MAIPDFQSLMLPVLRVADDGNEHSNREAIDVLGNQFNLSDEERLTLLPSGQSLRFDNRVHWAITHLKQAALVDRPRWGYFKITPRGVQVLQGNPQRIDMRFLMQFPEFLEFRKRFGQRGINGNNDASPGHVAEVQVTTESQTPEELMWEGYQRIRQDLAQELLARIKGCSPSFFERLIIELLVRMGYGGSRQDAASAVGKTGDEGIDGIIKEDRLGLDVIYIQAKRWENSVGRPVVQGFVGALHGQRARKGVFITTSSFTREARIYVSNIESKVILIDGSELAELMIDHDVGVSRVATFDLKKADSDYFIEV